MNNLIEGLTVKEKKDLMTQLETELKSAETKKKESIGVYKEMVDEFVSDNVDRLMELTKETNRKVSKIREASYILKDLKEELYGENDQTSHTYTLSDGSASIRIGYNTVISFDGTESAGVEKIKNYIVGLAEGGENQEKLKEMVFTFLKPDAKTKMLNPSKIIELSKLKPKFNSATFDEGLDIIFDAQILGKTSSFVRGFKYIQIDEKTRVKKRFNFRI